MEKIKHMFKSISVRNGSYSLGLTAVVIAIAIVINLVAGQLPESLKNIDISENNLYEISDISTEMLDELDKPVKMTVIAELDSVDTRIRTFVEKYASLSDEIELEWVDSVQHPSILQEYETEGDVIVVECEDTGKSTTVSFSDIIQYDSYSYYMTGSMTETAFDGEGQLTSAVNYVTSEDTKKIYRTSGHGESTFSTSVSDLFTKNNLETEELNLSMNPEIPEDCDLLFLYAPTADITEDEKNLILDYLGEGGKVYLILGDTAEDTPNLDEIMADYGLETVDGYIADTQRNYQGNYYAIFPELSLSGGLGEGISNEMVLLYNSQGLQMNDLDSETIITTTFMETSSDGYAVTEENQTQGQYILGAYATDTIQTEEEDTDSEDTDSVDTDSEDTEEDSEETVDETETLEARLTVVASASLIDSSITEQLTTLDNLTLFMNSVTENFDGVENLAIEAKSLEVEYNTPLHAGWFSLLVIFVIPAVILIGGFIAWWRRRKS